MKVELLSITPNAEQLIEQAGRTCYQSQDKITGESSSAFIRRIIRTATRTKLPSEAERLKAEEEALSRHEDGCGCSRCKAHEREMRRFQPEYPAAIRARLDEMQPARPMGDPRGLHENASRTEVQGSCSLRGLRYLPGRQNGAEAPRTDGGTMTTLSYNSSDFAARVHRILSSLEQLLISKNQHYGNSALDPVRIFSHDSAQQLIRARIDDKLSRIARGDGGETERQAREDLMGYLVLLEIAEEDFELPEEEQAHDVP